jgi:plastocyanin
VRPTLAVDRARRTALAVRAGLATGLAVATLVAAGQALTADAGASAHAALRTRTVVIENLRFVPETLEVRRGDTVVWVNRDLVPHTVTATDRFDSGDLATHASWKHAFTRPGTLAYVCRYHPTMKGQVIVR